MPKTHSRRQVIKLLGLASGTLALQSAALDSNDTDQPILLPENAKHKPLGKPISAITCGAGARGNVYGNYAVKYPDQLRIIGVAEPIALRNERYAKKHGIASDKRWTTWEDVFKQPKMADAIIISTPDDLHFGPCMAALQLGYDILLEKPIAPTERECRAILALAKKQKRIVAVCHVLRYAPYFLKLRELMQSGALGRIISVQHLEPIEHVHMSHSYVRGNWHNSMQTTPIILAKSCHDLDMLKWLIGKPCQSIHAMGSLTFFNRANAPAGSTERCMDGCAVEATCPYSAKHIYLDKRSWTYVFDLPEDKALHSDAIKEYLRTTNYGRCVFRMENDQPDHYITNIQFADGVTASFSMEAFTSYHGRRTRVMGSLGDIVGDMTSFVHTDFRTGKTAEWKSETDGHGGGDWRLVADWVQAVAQQDASLLTSTIDASIESHLMGFAAEKSRKQRKVVQVKV